MQCGSGGVVGIEAQLHQLTHHSGDDVGSDRNKTHGTANHEGQREWIIAGKDRKIGRKCLHELVDALH